MWGCSSVKRFQDEKQKLENRFKIRHFPSLAWKAIFEAKRLINNNLTNSKVVIFINIKESHIQCSFSLNIVNMKDPLPVMMIWRSLVFVWTLGCFFNWCLCNWIGWSPFTPNVLWHHPKLPLLPVNDFFFPMNENGIHCLQLARLAHQPPHHPLQRFMFSSK